MIFREQPLDARFVQTILLADHIGARGVLEVIFKRFGEVRSRLDGQGAHPIGCLFTPLSDKGVTDIEGLCEVSD